MSYRDSIRKPKSNKPVLSAFRKLLAQFGRNDYQASISPKLPTIDETEFETALYYLQNGLLKSAKENAGELGKKPTPDELKQFKAQFQSQFDEGYMMLAKELYSDDDIKEMMAENRMEDVIESLQEDCKKKGFPDAGLCKVDGRMVCTNPEGGRALRNECREFVISTIISNDARNAFGKALDQVIEDSSRISMLTPPATPLQDAQSPLSMGSPMSTDGSDFFPTAVRSPSPQASPEVYDENALMEAPHVYNEDTTERVFQSPNMRSSFRPDGRRGSYQPSSPEVYNESVRLEAPHVYDEDTAEKVFQSPNMRSGFRADGSYEPTSPGGNAGVSAFQSGAIFASPDLQPRIYDEDTAEKVFQSPNTSSTFAGVKRRRSDVSSTSPELSDTMGSGGYSISSQELLEMNESNPNSPNPFSGDNDDEVTVEVRNMLLLEIFNRRKDGASTTMLIPSMVKRYHDLLLQRDMTKISDNDFKKRMRQCPPETLPAIQQQCLQMGHKDAQIQCNPKTGKWTCGNEQGRKALLDEFKKLITSETFAAQHDTELNEFRQMIVKVLREATVEEDDTFDIKTSETVELKSGFMKDDYINGLAFYAAHQDIIDELFRNPQDKSIGSELELSQVPQVSERLKTLMSSTNVGRTEVIMNAVYTLIYIKRYMSELQKLVVAGLNPVYETNMLHVLFLAYLSAQAWMHDAPLNGKHIVKLASRFFAKDDGYSPERVYKFLDVFDWDLVVSNKEYEQEKAYLVELAKLYNIRRAL